MRKPSRPVVLSRTELHEQVWSRPMSVVAREHGISGNALAKICSRLHVPYPTRGHWSKVQAGKVAPRLALPPAPEPGARDVRLSRRRAPARRSRTRLAPDERRLQLTRTAASIATKEGVHALSMKRIAAAAGISETQAYNYFRDRDELLIELVRTELAEMRAASRAMAEQATDYLTGVRLSTEKAVEEIARRGNLLQTLLRNPRIRAMLRKERRQRHNAGVRGRSEVFAQRFGTPAPIALGATAVLTTLTRRAGTLAAEKRISVATAKKLCLSIVLQAVRDLVARSPNAAELRR